MFSKWKVQVSDSTFFPLKRTSVVVVQSPSYVQLFMAPWTAACQASLALIISWSMPKFTSIALVMPSSHLILWHSLLLSVFPSISVFPMSWLFTLGDQNVRASTLASVLPMSIQGWLTLKLTGLISFLPKGLSRVFSSITVQRRQFFGALPSLWSRSHNHPWPLERP